MAQLTADDFDDFFTELWEVRPFRWQTRLVEQVLGEGRFPDVVDLPTGSGKTSLLDVATFALAVDPERFARRIAFVIDRRVVVDQTSERAEAMCNALQAPPGPVSRRVAAALSGLTSGDRPLEFSRLRGGIPLDVAWARQPDQPTLIVSTVDQVGSRLLFRGYGLSSRMWPVHAGLTGNDCLLLLDEVHLSTAFAETASAVRSSDRTVRGLPSRGQVVEMSATPTNSDGRRFGLQPDDLDEQESELARRVGAAKHAQLRQIGNAKRPPEETFSSEALRLVDELPGDARVIGIVVNRVRTAHAVASVLGTRYGDVHLVTGRMRPLDRAAAVATVIERADPSRDLGNGDVALETERTLVVATQTIEVGADISFDAMITEIAPLDSLRQRFGRLDRRGAAAAAGRPAHAFIVGSASTINDTDDPIYGPALASTWDALRAAFGDETFDVGPQSNDLAQLDTGLVAPRNHAPVLLDPHLDQLVQTEPRPWVDPDIGLLLHGVPPPGESAVDSDVGVVWRSDIDPVGDSEAAIAEALRLLRPRADEALPVPVYAFRAWMRDRSPAVVGDVPSRGAGVAHRDTDELVVRWRGPSDVTVVAPDKVRAGDTVIVNTRRGGISFANWDPSSTDEVSDVAHEAAAAADRRVVRFTRNDLPAASRDEFFDEEVTASRRRQILREWRDTLSDDEASCVPLHPVLVFSAEPDATGAPPRMWLQEARPRLDHANLDGSDETNSMVGTATMLASHLDGVGRRASEFALNLGLSQQLVADVELAGRVHDIGKVDRRFQLMLHGDPIAYALAGDAIAKSRPGSTSRRRFGYPVGARHEFASLALLESESDLIESAHDPDLVRHLVITHHGYARPLPLAVRDDADTTLDAEACGHRFQTSSRLPASVVGPESAERFWRLIDRYGTHGLAWLEAIVRLADHRQSEAESEAARFQRNGNG